MSNLGERRSELLLQKFRIHDFCRSSETRSRKPDSMFCAISLIFPGTEQFVRQNSFRRSATDRIKHISRGSRNNNRFDKQSVRFLHNRSAPFPDAVLPKHRSRVLPAAGRLESWKAHSLDGLSCSDTVAVGTSFGNPSDNYFFKRESKNV